jgi:hypothetical protein
MTRSSILDLPFPDPIELRDPSLGRMLAAPLRLNILADVADIPFDNISVDDFAVRFLASVARQVSEEAQAIRDNYEAAMSLDAAAFRALSKDALDKLVGTYLAAEAKSIVMKSRSNHGTIDALPGERESERLLRLIKIAVEDFRTTVEKSVGTFRQHFAHIQASLNYIGQSNQAAFAALHKIMAPRLHLPEIKLPDLSGQIASVAQAMAPIRRQQVEFVDLWRGITEQLRPATEKFIESIRDFHKGFQARLEHYPKLSENIMPLA